MGQPIFVLHIDDAHLRRFESEPFVSVHRNLQEAEEMLRLYAAEFLPGARMADSEIVKTLAEYNECAHLFACTTLCDLQKYSTELVPFTQGTTKEASRRGRGIQLRPNPVRLPGFAACEPDGE
jgi:hypothetical protein